MPSEKPRRKSVGRQVRKVSVYLSVPARDALYQLATANRRTLSGEAELAVVCWTRLTDKQRYFARDLPGRD